MIHDGGGGGAGGGGGVVVPVGNRNGTTNGGDPTLQGYEVRYYSLGFAKVCKIIKLLVLYHLPNLCKLNKLGLKQKVLAK